MFRFLGLRTVFYRTHIDNSSLWTEVIYILYKYSINNNNKIIYYTWQVKTSSELSKCTSWNYLKDIGNKNLVKFI